MGVPTKVNGLEILNRLTNTGVDAAIVLPELASAPTTTTNKLYNHNGVIYFDGNSLEGTGGGGVGNSLNESYENGAQITVDSGAVTLVDATTSTANTMFIQKNGAGSGALISLDLNSGIAAKGIFIDNGAGARTGADISVQDDSTGTHSVIDIASSGSGASTGFAWTDSYNGSDAAFGVKLTLDANDGIDATTLQIVRGAGLRTSPAIDINDGSTGSAPIIDVDITGVFTGNVIDFASSAAATGNVMFVNLDTAVAMTAIHLEGSGTRTQPMIEVFTDCIGSANMVEYTITGAISGNVLDFSMDTTSTGAVIAMDMNAAVGAIAWSLDYGAGIRTAVAVQITADGAGNADCFNIDESNTGSGNVFDINVSGIGSGNVIDITYSAADTGDAISVVMANNVAGSAMVVTGAGARTDDMFKVDDSSTSNSHVWDVNISGNSTGNVLDIVYSSSAVTGDAIHVDMGTNLAGNAMQIDAAGVRTAPIIYIANTATDGGIDDHVLFIYQTGLLNSSLICLEYGTAASDGAALFIAMGTNVAGQAINVTSSATGTSGFGSVLNITHDGDLDAGADLAMFSSTGSPSSTSNVVSIEQTTGAGSAGAYGLYINTTGTNVEALKVDAGAVVFDETLLVTGVLTATAAVVLTAGINGKVIFSGIETIAGGGTTTALSLSKSLHSIDADAGGDIFTLADGTIGQVMTICLLSATGVATITPANLNGGTSVTLNAAGDSVVLQFVDTNWYILGGNSYAVV